MKRISAVIILLLVTIPIALFAVTEEWVYRYDGPEHLDDRSSSVMFGTDAQLYTAGYSYVGYAYRALIIGLTRSGGQRWFYSYDVPGYEDAFNDLVEGAGGDIYAAGYSDAGGAWDGYDLIVAAVDTAGNGQWTYRYDTGPDMSDVAFSICSDSDGNLYAAGYSWDLQQWGTATVPLVVSVDSTGQFRWAYHPAYLPGSANSQVCGPDGNIYVAGFFNGDSGGEFCVISLTRDGAERWIYTPAPSQQGGSMSITFDANGNLYAAGDIGNRPAIVALDTAGVERWSYTYDDSTIFSGNANAGIVCAGGNIYTAGTAYYPIEISYYDWVVVSVDTAGQERWTYRYDHLGGNDQCSALVYDFQTRLLYATGYSQQTILPVVSLDTNGQERWVYSYDYGPYDDAYAIAANGGQIAVAGESGDWNTEDLTVIRLSEGAIIRGRRGRARSALP